MEIIKIRPQGFCYGVVYAIKLINNLLDNPNTVKPIYMLGGLVHNKHIIKAYEEKGIEIIDNFDNLFEGTIIVTAHGIAPKKKEQMVIQGLTVIDATCKEVTKIHNIIIDKINEGYDILYYGAKNHPESQAVLGLSNKIHLISCIEDIALLNYHNNKFFFTNQTTMSYMDTVAIIEDLKIKFPDLEVQEDICEASKLRQLALLKYAKTCDLCLIVGDTSSNNSNKLKEICEKYAKTKAYLIEKIEDIKTIDLTNIQRLGITAGASTPNILVDEIIEVIKENKYISKVTNQDYLKLKKHF